MNRNSHNNCDNNACVSHFRVKQCKALTKDKNGSLQKAGGSIARAIYEMLSRAIRGGSIRKESVLGTLNELTVSSGGGGTTTVLDNDCLRFSVFAQ